MRGGGWHHPALYSQQNNTPSERETDISLEVWHTRNKTPSWISLIWCQSLLSLIVSIYSYSQWWKIIREVCDTNRLVIQPEWHPGHRDCHGARNVDRHQEERELSGEQELDSQTGILPCKYEIVVKRVVTVLYPLVLSPQLSLSRVLVPNVPSWDIWRQVASEWQNVPSNLRRQELSLLWANFSVSFWPD